MSFPKLAKNVSYWSQECCLIFLEAIHWLFYLYLLHSARILTKLLYPTKESKYFKQSYYTAHYHSSILERSYNLKVWCLMLEVMNLTKQENSLKCLTWQRSIFHFTGSFKVTWQCGICIFEDLKKVNGIFFKFREIVERFHQNPLVRFYHWALSVQQKYCPWYLMLQLQCMAMQILMCVVGSKPLWILN